MYNPMKTGTKDNVFEIATSFVNRSPLMQHLSQPKSKSKKLSNQQIKQMIKVTEFDSRNQSKSKQYIPVQNERYN
jgi:hypothetical protein